MKNNDNTKKTEEEVTTMKENGSDENSSGRGIPGPTNPMVTPLLTDLYQFTMAYTYWKAGKHEERAIETLLKIHGATSKLAFPGSSSAIDLTPPHTLHLNANQCPCAIVDPIATTYPYPWQCGLEECIRLISNYKLSEEDIDFIRSCLHVPCEDGFFEYLRGIDCSDVEVYAIPEGSVVFPKVPLMRVEGPIAGPDGGMGASKYCYIGGFDATSYVAAGRLFGIPLRGTHSHAFVSSFMTTYDVIRSGIPNFCAVALALNELGYKAVGIRLDSGDLAYLSCQARKIFCCIEKEFAVSGFGKTSITASNDLNEETLDALNKQGHEVDAYGIGTYLVTCYAQAALGIVFKLVEINKQPRIKLSEDVSKVSIPCKKKIYRLYGKESYPLVDIMTGEDEPPPKVGERILCRHPFEESKRAYVVPQHVEELLRCYSAGTSGKETEPLPPLKDIRERCIQQLEKMRPDHMRRLNPTPYKVSVSGKII
ncbi:hypothetical protein AAHE18_05G058900 [Arachis hypogaea]